MNKVERIDGWQCTFCKEIWSTEEEARLCYDNHSSYDIQVSPFKEGEYPVEVLIKKVEGGYYTEVATYEYKEVEKIRIPVKEGNKE